MISNVGAPLAGAQSGAGERADARPAPTSMDWGRGERFDEPCESNGSNDDHGQTVFKKASFTPSRKAAMVARFNCQSRERSQENEDFQY